ncbi:plasmid mobilization relaxosome protein MobC [Dysgonomonas sp. Marseille-P4361]|uniref:plasmid mobilization protein n=1 Tax=Dysgonomonas sp. Marseille-P4361 TaxID=2161820 RepID=UPI000D55CE33|nr:plasmid mobilization relaxosome protein MobC [Dysgonomonas sp. Marseille-P4361]
MENKKKNGRNNTAKGRPAKGDDKLSVSINLKLTEADYNSIKEKAEKLRLTPTQYAREMTLKGSVKNRFSLEELDLIRKVAGMANNLNQLAKKANQEGFENASKIAYMLILELKNLLYDR